MDNISIDLIANNQQVIDLLKDMIEEYKRLDTVLEATNGKVKGAFKNTQAPKALSREVGGLDKNIRGMNTRFDNARKKLTNFIKGTSGAKREVKDLGNTARKEVKSLEKIGDALIGGIVKGGFIAAAGTLLNNAAKLIANFDDKLKETSSITGIVGEALDDLGERSIRTSLKFGTAAADIVDGFALVASKNPELLTNADALADITDKAEILSKAAKLDLATSIDAVVGNMNRFGIETNKVNEVIDILATSQQKGTARIRELTEALDESGGVVAKSNIDFQQANAVFQAMAKGQIEGRRAGTAFRNILTILAETGRADLNPVYTDFNEILDTLANEIPDVTSATEFFGRENANAALTLVQHRDVVAELSGNLLEHGKALEQATTNTDTLNGRIATLSASWSALVLSVEDGDGVISNVFKNLVKDGEIFLQLIRGVNEGEAGLKELGEFFVVDREGRIELGKELQAEAELAAKAFEGVARSIRTTSETQGTLAERITNARSLLKSMSAELSGLTKGSTEHKVALSDLNATQERLNKLLEEANSTSEKSKKTDKERLKRLKQIEKEAKAEEKRLLSLSNAYDALSAKIKKQTAAAQAQGLKGEELILANAAAAKIEIDNLEEQAKKQAEAAKRDFTLQEEFAELRVALEKDTGRKLAEFRIESQLERLEANQAALEAEAEIKDFGTGAEISREAAKQVEILRLQKNALEARKNLLIAAESPDNSAIREVEAAIIRNEQEKTAIINDEALKRIETSRTIQLQELDSIRNTGKSTIAFDEAKNKKRIEIELKAARARVAIIQATFGVDSDEARIIEASIKNYEKLLEDAEPSSKEFNPLKKIKASILKSLNITNEEFAIFEANIVAGFDALFSGKLQNFQPRINSIQKEIDNLDAKINKTTGELEIALRRDSLGLANNSDALEQELKRQTEARDEHAKELARVEEEQAEAQEKARRRQIIANAVLQGSNIVTAGTELIASSAKGGLIGLIIGLSSLGLLLSTFASLKSSAAEATAPPKFRTGTALDAAEGLVLDGLTHEYGGTPVTYIDPQGRERLIEAERDQVLVGTAASKEHRGHLLALNDGKHKGDDIEKLVAIGKEAQTGGFAIPDLAEAQKASSPRSALERQAMQSAQRDGHLARELKANQKETRQLRESVEKLLKANIAAINKKPTIKPLPNGYIEEIETGGGKKTKIVSFGN